MGVRHSLQNNLDANVSREQETIRVDRILNLSSAPPKAGFSTCSVQHAIRTGHVFGLLNISGSGSGPAVWSRSLFPFSGVRGRWCMPLLPELWGAPFSLSSQGHDIHHGFFCSVILGSGGRRREEGGQSSGAQNYLFLA